MSPTLASSNPRSPISRCASFLLQPLLAMLPVHMTLPYMTTILSLIGIRGFECQYVLGLLSTGSPISRLSISRQLTFPFGEFPEGFDLGHASSRMDGPRCSSLFRDSRFQMLRLPCLQDSRNVESRYADLASLSGFPPIASIVATHPLEMNGPDFLSGSLRLQIPDASF
jgi:hypothetical protein